MSISLRLLGTVLLLLIAPSCQRRVKYVTPLQGAPIVLRAEVSDGEDWVVEFFKPEYVDEPVFFGEAHFFKLGKVELLDQSERGYQVFFEVVESERVGFYDFTKTMVKHRVAFEVDGEIYSVPWLDTALRGNGIIGGGESGLTIVEANDIIATLEGVGG